MLLQISSGQGPAECELCVKKLYDSLKKEYDDLEVISQHPSKNNGCYTSIMFKTDKDLSKLEGTVQWICQSPFRPEHKRKNWFVDVSVMQEAEEIDPKISADSLRVSPIENLIFFQFEMES